MGQYANQYLRLESAELKRRLVEDAEAQGSSVTAVGVAILAKAFGVSYVPVARQTPQAAGDSTNVLWWMPGELRYQLGLRALEEGTSKSEVARRVLYEHYGLATVAA